MIRTHRMLLLSGAALTAGILGAMSAPPATARAVADTLAAAPAAPAAAGLVLARRGADDPPGDDRRGRGRERGDDHRGGRGHASVAPLAGPATAIARNGADDAPGDDRGNDPGSDRGHDGPGHG